METSAFPFICSCGYSTMSASKAYSHTKEHCIDCGKKVGEERVVIDEDSYCPQCARLFYQNK